ncbi:glycosyltransferase family 1 protein [Sphingomonas sp. HDW15A]|uniref:glycosyltransferase n=1 Tax=Sphingomonas sp. HDW15A TaxID=2714942 RepID=UPI001409C25A|nr:glycosyltransferase [Sphingomonas sp. HDW15A]QIK96426.1 glycosyltransferase family 1 protein [Sphingomonas sp. HDW15A]
MSRHDPPCPMSVPEGRLLCDLTQSWSAVGGGVGTYLRHKRQHILRSTPHRHLLIVPGAKDSVTEEGRAITATIASPKVPGSPNYRLLLRNGAVRKVLDRFRPDLIECQDAYNLPWAAIAHARRNPGTALVAAYCTDFPVVYVERPFTRIVGRTIAGAASRLCYNYCGSLYRRFDMLYAMSENGGAAKLRALGLSPEVVPLGVELGEFSPERRDPAIRATFGAADGTPLLIYAGRLDREKRANTVVEAFQRLPDALGARLLLVGDGPLREEIVALADPRIHAPGYIGDRNLLATLLASADLYVSGMADETFGISIIEAQASGLPVVGVAAGAMIDRVDEATGRLGPVDDSAAMAANIVDILSADHGAMSRAAVAKAHYYGWDRSMEQLFGSLYPLALRSAAQRSLPGAATARPAFAEA